MNATQRAVEAVVPLQHARRDSGAPARGLEYGRRLWALVAAAAIVAVGTSIWIWDFGWHSYATAFGEQKMVELADGSTIHLNTGSLAKVRYGEAREIELVAGEGLFKVRPDPARPFRVQAGGSVIQAVGTQFNVNRRASATVVSVLEGSVRITSKAEGEPMPGHMVQAAEPLMSGQEARIAPHGEIEARRIDVRQAAAWRARRLVFLNDTLSDIAAEFNRYNRRPQVRIEDEAAGRRRFAASFDADAPEALVQVLRTNPELMVEQVGDEIRVSSR